MTRKPMTWIVLLLVTVCFPLPSSGCTGGGANDAYRVVRKTDSNGRQVVIALGEDAKISCETNVPWKKCVWKPPRNGVRDLKCEFDREQVTHWTCPSFPEVNFDREPSNSENCAIVIKNIQEHHEGDWRCEFEVESPEDGETIVVKDKVKLIARGWRYP